MVMMNDDGIEKELLVILRFRKIFHQQQYFSRPQDWTLPWSSEHTLSIAIR